MKVELLYFQGCPGHEPTRELLREVVEALGVEAEIVEIDVVDAAMAERERFLGSPSVRVDGRDVEPGADERTAFGMSCRLYGSKGVPPQGWIEAAILGAGSYEAVVGAGAGCACCADTSGSET